MTNYTRYHKSVKKSLQYTLALLIRHISLDLQVGVEFQITTSYLCFSTLLLTGFSAHFGSHKTFSSFDKKPDKELQLLFNAAAPTSLLSSRFTQCPLISKAAKVDESSSFPQDEESFFLPVLVVAPLRGSNLVVSDEKAKSLSNYRQ